MVARTCEISEVLKSDDLSERRRSEQQKSSNKWVRTQGRVAQERFSSPRSCLSPFIVVFSLSLSLSLWLLCPCPCLCLCLCLCLCFCLCLCLGLYETDHVNKRGLGRSGCNKKSGDTLSHLCANNICAKAEIPLKRYKSFVGFPRRVCSIPHLKKTDLLWIWEMGQVRSVSGSCFDPVFSVGSCLGLN